MEASQAQQQPQAGGQEQQMQQLMQAVQQMVQQGMQPLDIAKELLQQIPPEAIMQIFVQLGIPEQEAQATIQEAMQGGQQQQQGQGEEQLEGAASNPQEESAESAPMEQGQMMFGGSLNKYADGGNAAESEMQAVMQKVQEMMQGGADARQVMKEIQAAAQQGQISPEIAQAVMQELSGQMQATDPQLPEQGMNPQSIDPNLAAPDSQMMAFGGTLKKLMTKSFGGDTTAPSVDSKTYAKDRASMIVDAIKNSTYKSTLNQQFPSLMGNKMAFGGDLPKAANGDFNLKDYKTADEAELAAYRHRNTLSPEEQAKFDVAAAIKDFKAPEPTYEAGKNYQYDPATKGWKIVNTPAVPAVSYDNASNNTTYQNLYQGASPLARVLAGLGTRNAGAPNITGTNLPAGMSAQQFMQTAGNNMSGTIGNQTWKIDSGEKFKEGSIWRGDRRKGIRYTVDWGTANNQPVQNNSNTQPIYNGPGYSGFNADANGDNIPDYLSQQANVNGSLPDNPAVKKSFGGGIHPDELAGALNLINKAFGGGMPHASSGMNMNSGNVDMTNPKFKMDWNATGDLAFNSMDRLNNIFSNAAAYNPERKTAITSALNTQPNEYSNMSQGLYDQAGNFIPNDIGNQVLNPTDSNYNSKVQTFKYGGSTYELGGDIELDDNELLELQKAGLNFSKA